MPQRRPVWPFLLARSQGSARRRWHSVPADRVHLPERQLPRRDNRRRPAPHPRRGGTTPQPDDWDGIAAYENGTLDIEHADINYARVGVQGEPTGEQTVYITVDNNTLSHNATAISIAASPGTNAAIHRNWFDENGIALAGSSDWNPVDLVLGA